MQDEIKNYGHYLGEAGLQSDFWTQAKRRIDLTTFFAKAHLKSP